MPNAMLSRFWFGERVATNPPTLKAPASSKPLIRGSVATRCRCAARMTRRDPSAHFDGGRDMEAS